jgi:hypothetical protein
MGAASEVFWYLYRYKKEVNSFFLKFSVSASYIQSVRTIRHDNLNLDCVLNDNISSTLLKIGKSLSDHKAGIFVI